EQADAGAGRTPGPRPAPCAPQAPAATHGHRVVWTPGVTRAVAPPVAPESAAQGRAGVCPGPAVTPLCRPRRAYGRDGHRGARGALEAGEEGRRVCGDRRPAEARDPHPLRAGAPCHRAETVRHARVAP